jgi:hypothetical protein
MKLATPDADEVFSRFLDRADSKRIKKTFGLEKNAITAAENVRNIEKSAFLYFTSEVLAKKKQDKDQKSKSDMISPSKIDDIIFYAFSGRVDIENWKGNDRVPTLKDLEEVKCDKCGGKGTQKCKKCNDSRILTCKDCKDGYNTCRRCDGKGKLTIELEIREVGGRGDEKKKRERREHMCQECFGSGKISCRTCQGMAKIACYECKGNPHACNNCGGFGFFYSVSDRPVPLAIQFRKEFYSFMAKKDRWMLKDKEYNKKLESAETYNISEAKMLNEKNLRELFGVVNLDKDLQKNIDETKKTWENLEKDYEKGKSQEKPKQPISLIFLLRLDIETAKGKRFDIYALGGKDKYAIMTNGF